MIRIPEKSWKKAWPMYIAYEDLGRIPAKVTVSEVKRLQEEEEESLELYPAVRKSRETAPETGKPVREIQESVGENTGDRPRIVPFS